MNMKKNRWLFLLLFVIPIIAALISTGPVWAQKKEKPDAVTSATPTGVKQEVPENVYIYVGGRVLNPYRYNGKKLSQFATTRVRMAEVTPKGKILGTYIYTGIPVLHLLYKANPRKLPEDAFDRPLDMKIVFQNREKKKVSFSYGELAMAKDGQDVILAFHREPLLPSKDPDKYTKNTLKGNLKGLRLLCPKDKDNSRCLYDVIDLVIEQPTYPDQLLPKTDKKKECSSNAITCIQEGKKKEATFEGVTKTKIDRWVRIGHGRGIKGDSTATAEGYRLISFLKTNFPGCGADNDFLFVGCDGYRALLSGKEIFNTDDGESFIIFDKLNGKPTRGGLTLGTVADFFVDRNVWGLSHVLCVKNEE